MKKATYEAANRNAEPILQFLQTALDCNRQDLKLLEISSGSGQHAAFFAPNFPNIMFQPSECDESLLGSIDCWREDSQAGNICPAMQIDVRTPYTEWGKNPSPTGPYLNDPYNVDFKELANQLDYILNINMIHISPFKCTEGLFRNSSSLLKTNGLLITYGPYGVDGIITPRSNVLFDRYLRLRDSRWGVRDLTMLREFCKKFGFELEKCVDMPANNKICVWKKVSASGENI
ncbi:UPF0585 protein [Pseudolycoriella hygida]|uniref:UPF0585 protein n=1 Tax=Pseudolycoriella hygida TaxID=35572 RepID=A0A9Q0S8G0_9DIPT|nr:UPF0585 protein [Pseudolycoriella hygida]